MPLPQLRIRTEFSFRETFAPLPRVVERLKELGCDFAAIVDTAGSAWGHVRWGRELRRVGIRPAFGIEVAIAATDGRKLGNAWVLGADMVALNNAGTLAHAQAADGAPTLTAEQFLSATGLIRFTGTAFHGAAGAEAVERGCIVDLNPGNPLATARALKLVRETGAPAVLTGDNYFAAPRDRKLHELIGRTVKPTAQHILSEAELRTFSPLNAAELAAAEETMARVAAMCAQELPRAPIIEVTGNLEREARAGQQRRLAAGHIAAWNEEYEARFRHELVTVLEKRYQSYFLVVAELVIWAKQRMLVGPARGSSAGSLLCYLLGITEVDPMPFGLLFERFVDLTRKDLPDIDIDFPDAKRDLVYDHLRELYGAERVARIGTVSQYKPNSALIEVAKRLRIPPWETQSVKDAMFLRSSGDSRVNNCLMDTLVETEPGRKLVERFPAITTAGEIEGHASHTGQHAAGVIVCNRPVSDFCVVANGIACVDKVDAEELGLLKIDALGLRTLSVIEDAGVIDQAGIYNLKLTDPAVFALIRSGRYTGIFQWEGPALQSLSGQIAVESFEDMAHITALARPGPLGGGAATHFAARKYGREAVEVAHPSMMQYLGKTHGLVLYQEQVMRITREIGQFSWEDTAKIRKLMSNRKGVEAFGHFREKFIAGATSVVGLTEREATDIWEQIDSMGAWAFNESHSISYAIVSYWTAWCKAHHPLPYAAAALRNAKDESTALSLLREIVAEGVEYIPFDPDLSEENWSVRDGKLVGGFLNLKGVGAATAAKMIAARRAGGLTEAQRGKLEKAENLYGELYPAHAQWRAYYEAPETMNLMRGTRVLRINELPDGEEVVFIGQLKKKDSRDHNEAVRLAKRGGRKMTGPTAFLDMRVADDSTLTPLLCRVDRYDYEPLGRMILERGREDHHWFLIRGEKLRGFPMVQVSKARCLNEPDLLTERS